MRTGASHPTITTAVLDPLTVAVHARRGPVESAMNPPAYTATASSAISPSRRSIQDTRALILGNAAILKPRKVKDEDIELIVVKRRGRQESAEEVPLEQHYAFLVTRKANENDINIVVKGQPKDTIEEALEWMLDRTETIMEKMLTTHGKNVESLGCCFECIRVLKASNAS